ncbi:CNGA4 protein, partial [Pandion haliaetus]|nr:CNGA4 protein [Pandion haliaetus]
GFLEDGILVRDRGRIQQRYLRSPSFPWDLVTVLPTDLLYLCLGPGVPAVRANRCLRAPRLFEAFDRWETRTAHPNAFRVAKLMLYVFITIHWHGCLYFALSSWLGLGTDAWVCPNASRPGFARPLRQYLHSFYFSTLILTTVGDMPEPQREEEFLFVTAGFLLAVLGFATITGSISSVISNMNAADAAFYPDPQPVRRYLRAQGVRPRRTPPQPPAPPGLTAASASPGNTSGNRRTANIMSIGYSDLFCLSKEDLAEVLAEFPSARAVMEAKGRELLLRMGKLDVHTEAAAAEAERRAQALETAWEGLQTRAARLLAQLESSAFKLALRVQRLERRLRRQRPAGAAG